MLVTTFRSREEWLKNRAKGIGGSDISAVVGLNPYKSNIDLWEEKTGRRQKEDISSLKAVRYGAEAEKHIRSLFMLDHEEEYDLEYHEFNSYQNPDYSWALASVDGVLHDRRSGKIGILEIKTASVGSAAQYEKWKDDSIPDSYYCQCLLYMAVLEADFCILRAHIRHTFGKPWTEVKDYHIDRSDVENDICYIMESGAEFWGCVENDTRPALVLPMI